MIAIGCVAYISYLTDIYKAIQARLSMCCAACAACIMGRFFSALLFYADGLLG